MVKKVSAIFLYLLIVTYIVWEIYWYNQVGLSFIKWHTHLAFPFIVFLCLYHVLKVFKAPKKLMNRLFALYLMMQSFEVFVQVTGIGKTQTEKLYGHFSLPNKHNTLERYYWINKPQTTKHLITEEFHFVRKINSEGYSDVEWKIDKKTNEYRILCLGDSFTEGDGADKDSSYVAFLRREFQLNKTEDVTILNAGKCGSDPFFNYINFKDRLQKYKPDIIIQTLSTNDLLTDIILRGGFERFEDNWGLAFDNQNLFGSTLFALSYASRPFYYLMDYSVNFQKLSHPTQKQENKIFSQVKDLFVKYNKLAKDNGAKLLIVFLPQSDEVYNNYPNLTNACKEELDKSSTIFDLRTFYQQKTNESTIYNYYWVKDGHHNAKGYRLMAEGIYEFLKSEGFLNSNNKFF